jgi:hypothetical protein
MRETHNWIQCDYCGKRLDLGGRTELPTDWFNLEISGICQVKRNVNDIRGLYEGDSGFRCFHLKGQFCSMECVRRQLKGWPKKGKYERD